MSYEVKGKTTKIHGVSRCAMNIKVRGRDNYYTIELSEERDIPDVEGVDLQEEYKALFDSLNAEVDRQMEDIVRVTNPVEH